MEGSLGAQQELERLKITRERLSKYLRPKHPKIIKLDEEISRSEKLIDYLVRQSQEQLVKAKEGTKLKMETIQQNIKEWEAKVSSASERLAESQRLKVNVDRMRAFYEHLLGLLQNVEVSRNLEQEAITILDPASPTKDKKLPAVAVLPAGVVLGLLAGLALVFLVERWDDSVTSLEDARGRFDEWIVGQVPEAPKPRKKGRLALLERNDERDILGESFRNLRSALLFGPTAEMKPKVILVTSAIPHEGKSMVAANLARTIAFSGARVLLVDGDMRCGVLHEIFEVPCMPGLSELLTDGAEASSVIRPTSVPNLFILPCGTVAEGSGELFLGPVFDRFLTKVRQEYDFVVMDSVPVFAADDTTTLAPKMDGVLFVVRRSFTSARTTQRALELLYERQAQVLGLVFNRANTKQHSYYYYKYHKYYGQSKKAKRK